jgi:carbon storage regulator
VLVMRRRAGEGFVIGEGIEIHVLEVSGTRVKIGIVAPASVPIVRKEVELTREVNLVAASSMDPRFISTLLQKLPR